MFSYFKKIIFVFLLLFANSVLAQENFDENLKTKQIQEITQAPEEEKKIKPVITSEDSAFLDKKILFDASDSVLLDIPVVATYQWNFGDSTGVQIGKEVLHGFKKTGRYAVELIVQQGDKRESVQKEIFVYDKKIFLITDQVKEQNLKLISDQAADNGVLLKIISSAVEETGFLTEEKLVQAIKDNNDFVNLADALFFYSASSLDLKAFTRYWQSAEMKPDLKNKLLVKITDQNMAVDAQIVQQNFDVILPNFILLTRKEALNPIFEIKDYAEIVNNLKNRGIEYKVIDQRTKRSKIFALSDLITNFIAHGIPANTIYLILAFPFITFIIAFARQVIGISTFGVYTPTVLAVAFLVLGINFGLASLLIVVFVSYVLRLMLSRVELLYIPRLSLILSIISLSFLGVIWFLLNFGSPIAIPLAIFPLIVMSTMSEKFTSAQSESGLRGALLGAVETILVATVAYYFVIWTPFSNLLTSLPELIIVPLLGNIVLGRFTGLRLAEYVRFRDLLRDHTEE